MKVFFVLFTVVACLSVVAHSATCPASGNVLLPDTYSCSKFIRCENGVATESECSDGLFFAQVQQACTIPQQADCDRQQFACPRPYVPGELHVLAHGDICHYFFICANGVPVPQNCASGFNFNRYTHNCDESECLLVDWDCPAGTVVLPDPRDCSRFYHCENGIKYNGRCTGGFMFDTILNRCVDPRFAKC